MKYERTNKNNPANFTSFVCLLCLCFVLLLVGCNSVEDEVSTSEMLTEEPIPQDVYTNGTVSKFIDNGEDHNRINFAFIGDGFAKKDQRKWKDHVSEMTAELFLSETALPFGRYSKFFNVYRIDMVSQHSGLDHNNRNTPLRGDDECLDFRARDCHADWDLVHKAIDHYMKETPNIMRQVALNLSSPHFAAVHRPSNGPLMIYSALTERRKRAIRHENGHLVGGLADEYIQNKNKNMLYSGDEPKEVNVTITLNPLKWEHWKGYSQPYLDNRIVSNFEGGRYFGKGIYRPSENCSMNDSSLPFCAVCRETIIHEIYKKIDPIDSWNIANNVVTITVIDQDIFDFEWFVDDQKIDQEGNILDLNTLNLSNGTHSLKIIVFDDILNHSNTNDELDWVRSGSELLTQEISTQFQI